ncbi:unnamed protein product [Blepharisma stoltei]|uniref:Potassium channel domain-containing protein n=1 Tax=Blepharisma stoltei TaxID=1481888 RepID=A0AAU9JMH9_9CILI|nr:unnamed protein product [Blepharisma stoltei]
MSNAQHKISLPNGTPSSKTSSRASTKKRGLPKILSSFLPTKDIMDIRKSQRNLAFVSAAISILTLFLAFFENELEYFNHQHPTNSSNILRLIIMIVTILHMYFIYKYYLGTLEIKKAYKEVTKKSKIHYDLRLMRNMTIEMLLTCFCVPPYISWKEKFHQLETYAILSISDIIYALSFLRLYHIGKLLFETSSFNTAKAYFYSALQNTKTSVWFTLKCYMQMHPFKSIVVLSGSLSLVGGLILHVFERTSPASSFDYIWDAFWILASTQETVGYGDVVPETHLGRALVVVACVFGPFFVSSLVIIVREITSFSDNEIKLYALVKYKKRIKNKLADFAAILIQKWWKYAKMRVARQPRIKFLIEYQACVYKFNFNRVQIKIQKNPLFREQMSEVGDMTGHAMKRMQDYLAHSRVYESLGARYLKDEFSVLEKIKAINKNLNKLVKLDKKKHRATLPVPLDAIRRTSSHSSIGSNSSRAAMKGRRQTAVKKLIMSRLGSFDTTNSRSKSVSDNKMPLSPGLELNSMDRRTALSYKENN